MPVLNPLRDYRERREAERRRKEEERLRKKAEKNKKEYAVTRDEVIAQGYVPCKRCNP